MDENSYPRENSPLTSEPETEMETAPEGAEISPEVSGENDVPAPEDSRKKKKSKKNKKNNRKTKKKFRPFLFLLKVLLFLFLLAVIGVMAGLIYVGVMIYPTFISISNDMMTIVSELDANSFKRSGNSEIYDVRGNLIGQYGAEKYVFTDYEDISDYIIRGYIAQEDSRFYEHTGVDFQATARAAVSLVRNRGSITQGGSTITQQLVKTNLLTNEKSFRRKALEIMLSLEMEKLYSKEEIMEMYCNTCYYGSGCYGIEAASQYYFGVSCGDLDLAQAAILVGTSNSPNNYNPVASYEKAMQKKRQVLTSMLEEGYITRQQMSESLEEEPEVVKKSSQTFAEDYQNSYALNCAVRILMQKEGFRFQYLYESQEDYDTYQERYEEAYNRISEELRSGGYTIYTSLDPKIQTKLQKAVDENLRGFTVTATDGRYAMQGAAVCIDNRTQMVTAIVGGRGTEDNYNRGYIAQRQPGSSIKPLIDYGPALDMGLVTPSSIVNDKVIKIGGYEPKNAGGGTRGRMKLREALNRSLNTVAFKLYLCNGSEKSLSYLEAMEFSSLKYPDIGSGSMSIGGFTTGARVTDMARAYCTLANGGRYSSNTCVVSIEHYTKGVLYRAPKETKQVYSPETAYMLTDMLQGTFIESYGTAHSLYNPEQVYAGKTGTTNDSKDAWFCGYSAYYTTAVWTGYDMPTPIDGLMGSTYPGYIWCDFMNDLHQDLVPMEFEIPDGMLVEEIGGGDRMSVWFGGSGYRSRQSGWDYVNPNIDYDKTLIKDLDKYIEEQYPEEED